MIDTQTTPPRAASEDRLAVVPRRTVEREVRVGAFVIVGILAALVALLTFTDAGMFRGRYILQTQVANAGGLRRGDPVQMRGVNIGRVTSFEILPEGVAIRLEVEGQYPVPEDSHVALRSNGLLGGLVADIVPGRSSRPLANGAPIRGTSGGGSDIMATVAGVGTRADTVLQRAQALLSPQTVGAIGTSATDLQSLLAELQALAVQQRGELAALSASLRRSAGGVERATAGVERATAGPELARAIGRVDSLTLRLDAATGSLNRASNSLESVLGRLDRGEGTLGRLSRDDSLYNNLNQAAANMNRLAEDIRQNPKRYINVRVF